MTRRKALLVVLILAMGLFSVSTAGWLVNEIVTMWDVIFATGLTILSVITIADLWLGIFVVRKLNKRLGYEKFIWERVGVLPHQLPAWKWKAVALPRAEELLSGCAVARFSPAGCRPCPRSEQRDIEEKGGVLGNPQSLHLLRSRVYQEIVEGVLTLASPGRESRVVLSEPSNPSGKLGSLSESIKIFW